MSYQNHYNEAIHARSGSRLGIKYVDWDHPGRPGEVRVKLPVAGYGSYFANLDREDGRTPRLVLEDGVHTNARIGYPVSEDGPDFRKLEVTVDGEFIGYIPWSELSRTRKVLGKLQTVRVAAGSTFKGSQYADVVFTFGRARAYAPVLEDEELEGIYLELEVQREADWQGGRTKAKLLEIARQLDLAHIGELKKNDLGEAILQALSEVLDV